MNTTKMNNANTTVKPETRASKKLSFIRQNNHGHWVGDGFPVRTIFSYGDVAQELSPFLLMDYAGPKEFPITQKKLGVGEHPHRGFETVTIVYDGEVEHRDSAGGGGKIGPGDVQWMTAGSGLVHEEFHGRDFAKAGGSFHMIQLWVNLAKKDKMTAPGYQTILDSQIPRIPLAHDAGSVRVIAGSYLPNDAILHGGSARAGEKNKGPAKTFSPMNVWDVRLKAGHRLEIEVEDGYTTAAFVLNGQLKTESGELVKNASLAVFERDGTHLVLEVVTDTTLLFLNGQPLNEPIVGYGPFVMNTRSEIETAMRDYQSGLMGHLD
jgi:redox-sensitive bicupin YhaK (pirin superfamily)